MRPRIAAALVVATQLLVAGCALTVGSVTPKTMKTYVIVVGYGDKEIKKEIPADRITHECGCVLFWRKKVLDTVFCDHMGMVIVTEKN